MLRNKRRVTIGLLLACLVIFAGGMGAAWLARNDTICKDGKPPVRQRGGPITPVEYQCHNGQMVTK